MTQTQPGRLTTAAGRPFQQIKMPSIPISIQANRLATALIHDMKQQNQIPKWVQLHTLHITFVYKTNFKFVVYLTDGQRFEVEAAR